MKKLLDWAKGFLSDKGEASSKRLVGLVCTAFLCWTLYENHKSEHNPSDALVYAVAGLAAAALGFTSYEKAVNNKKKDETE
jgi:hypothetical protein